MLILSASVPLLSAKPRRVPHAVSSRNPAGHPQIGRALHSNTSTCRRCERNLDGSTRTHGPVRMARLRAPTSKRRRRRAGCPHHRTHRVGSRPERFSYGNVDSATDWAIPTTVMVVSSSVRVVPTIDLNVSVMEMWIPQPTGRFQLPSWSFQVASGLFQLSA
jgi:hypothetical protein